MTLATFDELKGHSADVRMRLLVNGTSLPMAQLGPDFLLLDTAIDHPPADASILLGVDESARQWRVHLPEGLQIFKAAAALLVGRRSVIEKREAIEELCRRLHVERLEIFGSATGEHPRYQRHPRSNFGCGRAALGYPR
jgi:hypothetical protein